jgi:hypothetical protein
MKNGDNCQRKPDSGVKGANFTDDLTAAAQSETLPIKGATLPPGISLHALTPEDDKDVAGYVEDLIHARAPLSEHWPPYAESPISAAVNLAKVKGEIKARTVERDLCGSKNIDAPPIGVAGALIEVAQMPAGKEMDSLIAERVMGWAKHPHVDSPTYWWEGPTKSYLIDNLPHFSSDIAAAWQVVEQLQQRGYTRITVGLQGLGKTVDFCHIEGDGPAWHEVIDGHGHDAFSLPLAICRGALGCVGEGKSSSGQIERS